MSNTMPVALPRSLINVTQEKVEASSFGLSDYAHLGEGRIAGGLPLKAADSGYVIHLKVASDYTCTPSANPKGVEIIKGAPVKHARFKRLFSKSAFSKRFLEESALGEVSGSVDTLARIISIELQHAVLRDPELRRAVTHFTTKAKPSEAQGLVGGLLDVIKHVGTMERDAGKAASIRDGFRFFTPYHCELEMPAMKPIIDAASLGAYQTVLRAHVGEYHPECHAHQDALAAARERGRRYKIEAFDSEEMLTPKKVGDIFGVTSARVSQMRNERKIFAVQHPLKPRSLRYPSWQLEDRVFKALGGVLGVFGADDGWGIWLFFTSADPTLRDFTPLEVLRGQAENAEEQSRLDAFLAKASASDLVQRAAKVYEHGGE